MTPERRYESKLRNLPPAGCGRGLHPALLGAANLGLRSGRSPVRVLLEIRNAIPSGDRDVPDREIWDAVLKAAGDMNLEAPAEMPALAPLQNSAAPVGVVPAEHRVSRISPPSPSVSSDGSGSLSWVGRFWEDVLERGAGATEQSLMLSSPIPIPEKPEDQCELLLRELYAPEDMLFCGSRFGTQVYNAAKYILLAHCAELEFIIPNPLTGEKGNTQSGKPSFRCDDSVKEHRYAVVEFDDIPLEQQYAFWSASGLPVAALIHSAGKSVHAWVRVDAADGAVWAEQVKGCLYDDFLVRLGVDRACKNPSRLSRMPGHMREGKGFQRLLYLDPTIPAGDVRAIVDLAMSKFSSR